jgi:hypothetical protein
VSRTDVREDDTPLTKPSLSDRRRGTRRKATAGRSAKTPYRPLGGRQTDNPSWVLNRNGDRVSGRHKLRGILPR